jgi:hypothetical protein
VPVGVPTEETTVAVNVTGFDTKTLAADETSVSLAVPWFTVNNVVAEAVV